MEKFTYSRKVFNLFHYERLKSDLITFVIYRSYFCISAQRLSHLDPAFKKEKRKLNNNERKFWRIFSKSNLLSFRRIYD